MRSIVEGVLRDESRHVAFGNVYVGKTLSEMNEDEREDVADFAYEALMLMVSASGRSPDGKVDGPPQPDPTFRLVLENSGIEPADFLAGVKEARAQGVQFDQPPGSIHSYKDLMMPALVRVGAITERIRAKLAAQGLHIFEDATVLESLEDRDTGEVNL